MGRTISAKFLHSADSVGKKVSRTLGITCLKPRNNMGRKAKAFVSTLAVGRILAAPSCSLITSLFSTASDECAISSERWFALASQVAEAKHVAVNESYVGTKDSERLSLRRRCIRDERLETSGLGR